MSFTSCLDGGAKGEGGVAGFECGQPSSIKNGVRLYITGYQRALVILDLQSIKSTGLFIRWLLKPLEEINNQGLWRPGLCISCEMLELL